MTSVAACGDEMESCECGGLYEKRHGPLNLQDEYMGELSIPAIDYLVCNRCGGYLFSPTTSRQIEKARDEKLDEVLRTRPIGAFVPSAEAAEMLGITRQALHKHRRVSRGFIFRILFRGRTLYLKESVELFRATGDGRFSLLPPPSIGHYASQKHTISTQTSWT